MNTKKVNVQMLEPQPTNGIRTIDTTSSQTIAKPNVRRSISWSEKEISMLMNYEESNDSETLDERLDSARYMLHYESGHDFPSRSLSSVKKKFYEECNKR